MSNLNQFYLKKFPKIFVWFICMFPLLGNLGITLFSSTFISMTGSVIITILLLRYKFKVAVTDRNYMLVDVFLLIAVVGIIRGLFVADNYWEYKNLTNATFSLVLPLFVYVFGDAHIMANTFRYWVRIYMPLFILIGMWILVIDGWHFFISPILILGCFVPIVGGKKWPLVFLFFLVVMLVGDIGARAQMMKAFAVLAISIGIYFRRIVPNKVLKLAWLACIVAPVVLLILGITGVFNVFSDNSERNAGKYTQTTKVNGEVVVQDASDDTRTFIYEEVIGSAVRNGYVLFGRTPARGNDSVSFGAYSAEVLKTGKYERSMNEVCHPNVFTWLGLLGMIPWCMIYIKSSWLALFRSRNVFMRFMGVFIAFRFFMGWIEDMNRFNILGISVWMLIAMGLSEQFRNMTNEEFKTWVNGCLPFKK